MRLSMRFSDFLDACKKGDVETVKRAMPKTTDRRADKHGITAVMWAAISGHADTVSVLLASSDLRQVSENGETALIWAAREGNA